MNPNGLDLAVAAVVVVVVGAVDGAVNEDVADDQLAPDVDDGVLDESSWVCEALKGREWRKRHAGAWTHHQHVHP